MTVRDDNSAHNQIIPTERVHRYPMNQEPTPLADELNRQLARFRRMGREISAFINGFQLNLDRKQGEVKINLKPKPRPLVELSPLLQHRGIVHPLEAVIGWHSGQAPMLWSLAKSQRHLLLSGGPESGKTGLLRSLLLTLVLASRPSKLQLAIIDGSCQRRNRYDHSELKRFSSLPHLLNRPPTNLGEVCEIIRFLSREADHRKKNRVDTPQILLVIDKVEDVLPVAGPDFHQNLEHILDIGPQTGISVILSTNRPEDGRLQDLIQGIDLDRIVGKLHSAGQAVFATGIEDTDAEYLGGNGEFLAVLNQHGFHFQAAWINDRQLNRYINHLLEPKQPSLLAWDLFVEDDEFEEIEPDPPRKSKKTKQNHIFTRIEPKQTLDNPKALVEETDDKFEDWEEEEEFFSNDEPLEDQEHQLGWRTVRPFAMQPEPEMEEPEEENEEEDFDFSAGEADSVVNDDEPEEGAADWLTAEPASDNEFEDFADNVDDDKEEEEVEDVSLYTRRSKLPRVKSSSRTDFKPVPKPSAEAPQPEASGSSHDEDEPSQEVNETADDQPFDPWQSGLDDEGEEKPIVLKNGFERPPRLAKKKANIRKRNLN